jgi:hypothetical protein
MTISKDKVQEPDEEAADESLESQAFKDALLNGDEKLNRLVKLVDVRFESQARRTNKARREAKEATDTLRRDLAPLIELAQSWKGISKAASYALIIVGACATVSGAIVSVLYALQQLGII